MLVGFIGQMGSGKTLGMTVLGIALARNLKLNIAANYGLKQVNNLVVHRLSTFNELMEQKSGIVLLDEFWQDVDSRSFLKNINFSIWINQTRKKDLMVFYTTQDFSQVDKRLRKATHWLVFMEKIGIGGSMSFVRVQDGKIGKKLVIPDYSVFFELYDTFEIVNTLSSP